MRRFPDLPLICGADVRGYLMHRGLDGNRLRAVPWGMMIAEAGIKIRPVYSRHWSYIQTEDGRAFSSTPLGFIVHIVKLKNLLSDGIQKNPPAPQPVIWEPGEVFSMSNPKKA